MIKHLQDLWILKEGGIVIFSKKGNTNINEQFIGGFISALSSFSKAILNEMLSYFATDNLKVKILSKNGFMFVGRFLKKVKDKQIMKELEYIVGKFFEFYHEKKLYNIEVQINEFREFGKVLEPEYDSLADYVSYVWNNRIDDQKSC